MQSDIILFWNDVALEANRVSFTNNKSEQPGPTLSSRALAIIHLAMYDAYIALHNPDNHPPYETDLPETPAIRSEDEAVAGARAAVAAAAYTTLVSLYPSQKAFFESKLPITSDVLNAAHQFGVLVAQRLLEDRKNDPGVTSGDYSPSGKRGAHREDPDNPGQGFHAAFYGARSKGFAISQRYGLAPPPLDNGDYEFALKQVLGLGIAPELMGSLPSSIAKRTTDQTLTGIYWGYDGAAGLGTPPRLYNQIIRQLAIQKENSEAENARLFALVNVAMADAGILAWDQKYKHDFWRPVVGIREHEISNNPISEYCDPNWLPLGAPSTNALNDKITLNLTVLQVAPTFPHNTTVKEVAKNFTPNFPAYPSGHATFGAAALHIARLFYFEKEGEDGVGNYKPDKFLENLEFVSDECNGENQDNKGTIRPKHTRTFPGGLWQMIEENGRSRVYLGVHWVFDAFAVNDDNTIDLTRGVDEGNNIVGIGGVPLGLKIAEDIFSNKLTRSRVEPR